jgi:3-oxoacyl-[acyl-carrier protein] reductase
VRGVPHAAQEPAGRSVPAATVSRHDSPARDLQGKVAIVTGGPKSIGAAIARALAGRGVAVVVNYRSSATQADALVEELRDGGGRAAAVQADVADVADLRRLFDETERLFGAPDIVVANAGVPAQEPLAQVSEAQYDAVFAVNTRGVFFTLQEAARRISDGGRIINISSSQTVHPAERFAVYAGSKAAPKLFVEVLAQELGSRQVTVNSVVAGPIDAGFLDKAPADYKQRLSKASPMGRLGTPEDIADVVAFLASDASRWISGQHLVVDGAATGF